METGCFCDEALVKRKQISCKFQQKRELESMRKRKKDFFQEKELESEIKPPVLTETLITLFNVQFLRL
jgi:hypothetical protein